MNVQVGQEVFSRAGRTRSAAAEYGHLSSDAFLSLGCMEGIYEPVVSTGSVAERAGLAWSRYVPGYALATGLALLAYFVHEIPVWPFTVSDGGGSRHPISAAMIAIIAGLLIRNLIGVHDALKSGFRHAVKKVIPIAIVLTGAQLNLVNLSGVGLTAMVIIVLGMLFAIAAGYYIGRWIGLCPKTALLLGAGTGICGNSAIVAVSPLIDAHDDDVAISVGAVNLLGLAAMLAWPMIGAWIGMTGSEFGVWSGVSIHAVPQVVAAGFAFSPDAGTLATLVKLVRVTLLAPLVFVLAIVYSRRHPATNGGRLDVHYARLVPWFVWGFVALALLSTLGLLPTLTFPVNGALSHQVGNATVSIEKACTFVATFFLTLAMAAIGLEVSVRQLIGVGAKALTAGLLVTAALGLFSLLLIRLLM